MGVRLLKALLSLSVSLVGKMLGKSCVMLFFSEWSKTGITIPETGWGGVGGLEGEGVVLWSAL